MERTDQIAAIEEAVDHIQANLDGDLSVDAIADRACFSRHYFNRLFSSVTGEPVHAFVRRLRLERAAFRLVKSPGMSLTEIALEARYSPSNFAVAFRERFGMSASEYRAAPPPPPGGAYEEALARIAALRGPGADAALADLDAKVELVELPELRLYRRRYRGPYSELARAWEEFCAEVDRTFPDLRERDYIGISADDPLITEGALLRYDLCVALPPGVRGRAVRVPAARYARYRFDGPVSGLIHAFNDLIAIWMPRRGFRPGPGPCLERYRSGLDAEGRVSVDICAPVEGRA